MIAHRRWLGRAALLLFGALAASGQGSALTPAQAPAFMGTWVFAMTNPAGSQQTVRIWDKNGVIAASLQVGTFPPTDVTGIIEDGASWCSLSATKLGRRCSKTARRFGRSFH